MVDAQSIGNSGDLFLCVWTPLPSSGTSWREQQHQSFCTVFIVRFIAVELLHAGDKYRHEQHVGKCRIGEEGVVPT